MNQEETIAPRRTRRTRSHAYILAFILRTSLNKHAGITSDLNSSVPSASSVVKGFFQIYKVMRWAFLVCLLSCSAWAESRAPVSVPPVIASYPHDPKSFTQGLLWHKGLLYESTGRYGHSTLSVRELETGRARWSVKLAPNIFGEGLALVGEELVQLSWKEHQIFVYDRATLKLKRNLPYAWEGWGAAYDGRHLIVSDGSAVLRFLDPVNFKEVRQVTVFDGDQPIALLNELEYVQGEILANVYGVDRIARISPETGKVIAWLDLAHLYPREQWVETGAVLNGIAYDAERQVLMVTGKYWPRMFLIPAPLSARSY